jgi:hypothetical protein
VLLERLMRLWARTRWVPEDPIHRIVRLLAFATGTVVVVMGVLGGNALLVGAGLASWKLALTLPK